MKCKRKALCVAIKDSSILENVSTLKAKCALVQAMIVTDRI